MPFLSKYKRHLEKDYLQPNLDHLGSININLSCILNVQLGYILLFHIKMAERFNLPLNIPQNQLASFGSTYKDKHKLLVKFVKMQKV